MRLAWHADGADWPAIALKKPGPHSCGASSPPTQLRSGVSQRGQTQ
jgi:hypothetical protein